VAKIDNNFIVNAQYRMSAKEQKVLYYLIAHLDPKNQTEFHKIKIHFNDIREMLKEGDHHYGSFQADMYRLCKSLISKHIVFPANFFYEGKEWSGFINWFQTIKPIEEDGQSYVEFHFSEGMKPFLLQLHQYVNINPLEVVPMQNAHAIRMYSIFKSEKDRMKNVKNTVTLEYLLEELKAILGISDKYTGDNFKDFRVYVLDKIRNEINDKTPTMSVEYDYIKTARKVTGVAFNVREKQLQAPKPKKEPKPQADIKTYIPSEKELEILSKAKLQAYHILIGFGIFEGIAYKQILPKVRGSEFEGYEDFFIEKAIQHFEKNAIQNTTKELKASTFVTWWTKNKVFESGDVWADILEKLAKHKKQLQVKTPVAFENRIIAKTMTNAQFDEYIKKNKA
jgi:hypothetical protein